MTPYPPNRLEIESLNDPVWLDIPAAKEFLKKEYGCRADELDAKLVLAIKDGPAEIAFCGPARYEAVFRGDEPDDDGHRYDEQFFRATLPKNATVTIHGNHIKSGGRDLLKVRVHETSLKAAMGHLNKKTIKVRRPGAGRSPEDFPWIAIEKTLREVWIELHPSSFEKLCLKAFARAGSMPDMRGKKLPEISTARKRFGEIYLEWKRLYALEKQ